MTEASGESRDKRRTHKVRGLASQLIHGAALRASRRAAPWAAAALWRCCHDDRPASPCSSRCCSGSSAACSTLGTSGVWKHKNIRGSNAEDKDVGESVELKQFTFSDPMNHHRWWCVAMNYGTSLLQCLVWFTCIISVQTDCRWLQLNSFFMKVPVVWILNQRWFNVSFLYLLWRRRHWSILHSQQMQWGTQNECCPTSEAHLRNNVI